MGHGGPVLRLDGGRSPADPPRGRRYPDVRRGRADGSPVDVSRRDRRCEAQGARQPGEPTHASSSARPGRRRPRSWTSRRLPTTTSTTSGPPTGAQARLSTRSRDQRGAARGHCDRPCRRSVVFTRPALRQTLSRLGCEIRKRKPPGERASTPTASRSRACLRTGLPSRSTGVSHSHKRDSHKITLSIVMKRAGRPARGP